MTIDEALETVCPLRPCAGWTLARIRNEKPLYLEWLKNKAHNISPKLKEAILRIYDLTETRQKRNAVIRTKWKGTRNLSVANRKAFDDWANR